MYTLRTIFQSGEEKNQNLGNEYIYIDSISAKEAYIKLFKETFPEGSLDINYFGVIIYNNNDSIWLSYNSFYYIMTDSGKTFKRLQ